MLRKLPLALALAAALGTTAACTDPYGRPDPLATGLLGAGIGAAAGLAIASANQPRRVHRPSYGWGHRPAYGYAQPSWGHARPGWGYGRPVHGWGQQAYGYGGGWGRPRYGW
jgi:hypothetical protein